MVVLREELEVDEPLEDAFAFVGDFANAEAWDPGVESSQRDGAPVGVGTRYDLTVVFGDRRLPMTYEVTVFDPPHRVVLRGTGSTVTAVDDIRFEPTPSGTRIRYMADLRLKGLRSMAEPLMRGRFEETGTQAIAGMTAAFEARSGDAEPLQEPTARPHSMHRTSTDAVSSVHRTYANMSDSGQLAHRFRKMPGYASTVGEGGNDAES